jgi:hypothetical protein
MVGGLMARERLPKGPVRDLMNALAADLHAPALELPVAGGKGEPRISWTLESSGGRDVLCARMALRFLERNIQGSVPAAPMYAFAVAYWASQFRHRLDVHVVLQHDGEEARDGPRLQHRRRALFLFSKMATLFSEPSPSHPVSFTVDTPEPWTWPGDPWFTVSGKRKETKENDKHERIFELSLCKGALAREAVDSFPGGHITAFDRQLPMTLFDGSPLVARRWKAWTPHGRSAIDVWAVSVDGKTFHELELKADENETVGSLSETLVYALLLEAANHRNPHVQGESDALTSLRGSSKRCAWVVAPGYHPLVRSSVNGVPSSPVEWIHARMSREDLSFRLMPVELQNYRWQRWRSEALLPC